MNIKLLLSRNLCLQGITSCVAYTFCGGIMNQESREDFKNILIERCKFLFAIGTTYAMDAAFLLVWLAIHNELKRGMEWFAPIGYEKFVGYLLKIILELPTLATVLVFIISYS